MTDSTLELNIIHIIHNPAQQRNNQLQINESRQNKFGTTGLSTCEFRPWLPVRWLHLTSFSFSFPRYAILYQNKLSVSLCLVQTTVSSSLKPLLSYILQHHTINPIPIPDFTQIQWQYGCSCPRSDNRDTTFAERSHSRENQHNWYLDRTYSCLRSTPAWRDNHCTNWQSCRRSPPHRLWLRHQRSCEDSLSATWQRLQSLRTK